MTVTLERRNKYLIMSLDRPQALNALNREMVDTLTEAIEIIETDPELVGGILRGQGDRAYCAGGDIKHAREAAMQGDVAGAMAFFTAEYSLNKKMFHCSKPLVAMMDGITMGGGVGISAPCRYRVATSKTVWAMPEVGIGFFPDVGGAYYLSRMPEKYGLFLGMTGARIADPSHLKWSGIATHILPSDQIEEAVRRITIAGEPIEDVLNHLSLCGVDARPPSDYNADYTISYDPSFAPLSFKIAEAHIKKAKDEDFDTVIARDLKLAEKFMKEQDFCEGVRAAVVDKDRNPQWKWTLESITESIIADYLN